MPRLARSSKILPLARRRQSKCGTSQDNDDTILLDKLRLDGGKLRLQFADFLILFCCWLIIYRAGELETVKEAEENKADGERDDEDDNNDLASPNAGTDD